jgi:hypothetical protein
MHFGLEWANFHTPPIPFSMNSNLSKLLDMVQALRLGLFFSLHVYLQIKKLPIYPPPNSPSYLPTPRSFTSTCQAYYHPTHSWLNLYFSEKIICSLINLYFSMKPLYLYG